MRTLVWPWRPGRPGCPDGSDDPDGSRFVVSRSGTKDDWFEFESLSNEEWVVLEKVLTLQMSSNQFLSLTFSKTETDCPRTENPLPPVKRNSPQTEIWNFYQKLTRKIGEKACKSRKIEELKKTKSRERRFLLKHNQKPKRVNRDNLKRSLQIQGKNLKSFSAVVSCGRFDRGKAVGRTDGNFTIEPVLEKAWFKNNLGSFKINNVEAERTMSARQKWPWMT